MISDWPGYIRTEWNSPEAEPAIVKFQEVLRGIRNTRTKHMVLQQ